MKKLFYAFLLAPLMIVTLSCKDDEMDDMVDEKPTLVEAAQAAGLTTLLDAIGEVNGLQATLTSSANITVFAPTNQAFNNLLNELQVANLDQLITAIGGVDQLETVLSYHVVASTAFSGDLSDGQKLNTLAGQQLTVNVSGSNVSITDASGNTFPVRTADVEIENGVVHVIDGVLLPELEDNTNNPTLVEAATAANLDVLLKAVGAVDGLASTLMDAEAITVFAPTDEAFGNALNDYGAANLDQLVIKLGGVEKLETVLGFHVVGSTAFSADLMSGDQTLTTLAGQSITVNKSADGVKITDATGAVAMVETPDVAIDNGVVHVIDKVLLPSLEYPTIVEAATAAEYDVLLEAVTAAGLGSTLLEAEAITVFAPTDAAFVDVLDEYEVSTLDQLIAEIGGLENLETILGFHVIADTYFSFELAEGEQSVPTLSGQNLTINRSGDMVTLTDAAGNTYNVSMANIVIDNGVVHEIDGVLLPEITLPSIVDAATDAGLSSLLDAVTAANLGETLTSAEAITVFAPTNAAFGDLLDRYNVTTLNDLVAEIGIEAVTEVLKFHVVPAVAFSHDLADGEQTFSTLLGQEITVTKNSEGVFVTDYLNFTYQVAAADVAIENGVVHVIEGVVLPDLSTDPNVVEAATTAGLTTLIDAVLAAELRDPLIQATEITVFAPTNAAFGDLLEAENVNDLDGLIAKLGAANVAKVLQFHVVPAVAFSTDLQEGVNTFNTLAGENLTVTKNGADVTVTDAAGNIYDVTTPNVTIENGVVHVIDGVLLPTLN